MEVSGVLMSWDTLVMSSVLKCSLFIRSFTARLMPSRMLFRSLAWSSRSPCMYLVSMV